MISEDDALKVAYDLHPELRRWSEKDFDRAERDTGVNWRLHLTMDAIVLRRMSDPALPDARVVRMLQERGTPHLDAIHLIANVLATAIWQMTMAEETAAGRTRSPDPRDDVRSWTNPSFALTPRLSHRRGAPAFPKSAGAVSQPRLQQSASPSLQVLSDRLELHLRPDARV